MKRIKNKIQRVDAIFTADWHLRESVPSCRVDDFWKTQWDKVNEVYELQIKYKCPVIHAGDLYHHWKPSPYLLSTTKLFLPENFITVYGQHDLPNHNMDLRHKSGIFDLAVSQFVYEMNEGSWNDKEPGWVDRWTDTIIKGVNIGIWHKFVWDGKKLPWPDCNEMTAEQILKKFPEFDVIVTGDHHRPFTYKYKDRLLVNCGCLTRQASDYKHHKPRVWLYNQKKNSVTPHYLKCDVDAVVSNVSEEKDRDEKIQSFISRISNEWELSMSFEKNLEKFFKKNKVSKELKEIIYKSLEYENL